MKISFLVTLFFCQTIHGQSSNYQIINMAYRELKHQGVLDLIMNLSDTTQNEPWNQYMIAKSFFATGRTDLAEKHARIAAQNSFYKFKIRWLLRAFIKKHEFEKNRKKQNEWNSFYKRLFPNGAKTCATVGRKDMYRMLISHYQSIRNLKGEKHFERQSRR